MAGQESDFLFGNLPPRYQALPTSRNIVDRRADAPDLSLALQESEGKRNIYPPLHPDRDYWPSPMGGVSPFNPAQWGGYDPMINAGLQISRGDDASTIGSYKPSFQQNMRPPDSVPAPYRPSIGPFQPPGPTGTSVDPEMPYMGPHLPISPGDPGWTPPPSPSGPHNLGGDPDRPGWANSNLPMGMGQISPDQMQSALQLWQTGQ